jgi:uncharacterized membrane protein
MRTGQQLWQAIGLVVLVAFLLFGVGALRNGTWDYWYLPYNLLLAGIPLGFAYWAKCLIKIYGLKNWRPIAILVLWLLFLPNSFYIVTDFIHLPEVARVDIVQDSVMIMLYSLLGGFFGFMSLLVVRNALHTFISSKRLEWGVGIVLFLSSFAIYLGRELRWNSWDIVTNPFGLMGSVLDIIIHPAAHPSGLWIMGTFFIVLLSLYEVIRIVEAKRT